MIKNQYLLIKILVIFAFVLAFIHIYVWLFISTGDVVDSPAIVRLFDMDSEENIPTLFSVVLCVILSIQFLKLARYAWQNKVNNKRIILFASCSTISILVGIDEWFQIHESLIDPVNSMLTGLYLGRHAWAIPGIILLFVLIYLTKTVWQQLSPNVTKLLLIGVIIFIVGAGGIEIVGGIYIEKGGNITVYKFITLIEELFEMLGIITIITATILYSRQNEIIGKKTSVLNK